MSQILRVLFSPRHPSLFISSWKSQVLKPRPQTTALLQHYSTARQPEQPYERRVEAGRINGLLSTIDRYVRSGNKDAVSNYVQLKFTAEEFHNPSRSLAYDKVIASLLTHKLLPVAIQLYERMHSEGLVPSLFVRVKMEAISIIHSPKTRKEVFRSLKVVFEEGSFDDSSLKDLIETLNEGVKAKYPPQTIDRIVKLFIESQGPNYKPPMELVCQLIDLLVRNQSPGQAEKWLDIMKEFDEADVDDDRPSPSSAAPHAAFLKALAETDPNNTAARVSILTRMQNDGITPDTPVFNSLIANQIGQGNLDPVFNLYSLLMQHRSDSELKSQSLSVPTLLPDATTFQLLFRALKLSKLPRGVRSRRHKLPKQHVPPRQLYGDMIECHLIQTCGNLSEPSSVIDTSSLHIALRTFMTMGDYAAAFVALRSFKVMNIPINLDTYQIIIKSLLRRMHHELGSMRGDGKRRWADVLLGREEGSKEMQVPGMNTDMIVQVMRYGLDKRITLHEMEVDSEELDDVEDHEMPSLALIMGQEPPNLNESVTYSPVPLERILRRALLARAILGDYASSDSKSSETIKDRTLTPSQIVSSIIADTKQTMARKVPDWVQRVKSGSKDSRSYRSRKSSQGLVA